MKFSIFFLYNALILTMHHLQWNAKNELNENVKRGMKDARVNEHVSDEPPDLLPFVRIVDETGAIGHWTVESDVAKHPVHDCAVVGEDEQLD